MKKVITEKDVIEIYRKGSTNLYINKGDIITPLAADKIKELKISVTNENPVPVKTAEKKNRIAIGSDHTGFQLKEILKGLLINKGFALVDVGTTDEKSCDYPDFALAVAQKVISEEVDFGVMIDATGIPSSITANKIPGIRAATCYNEFTAWSARNHNNANLLVLGAKAIGEESAKSILEKWLNTSFEGGRHQKRLDKISEIERKLFGKS